MKRRTRVMAILLACMLSASTILPAVNVYAEETNVQSTDVIDKTNEEKEEENTSEIVTEESSKNEDVPVVDEEQDLNISKENNEETILKEQDDGTQDEKSEESILEENSEESMLEQNVQADEKKTIVSFSKLERESYIYSEKPSFLQLESIFPDVIEAILADGTKILFPVSWQPEHDLKSTSYSTYVFHALMDLGNYTLDDGIPLPTIEVKIRRYAESDQAILNNSKAVTYQLIKTDTKYHTGVLRVGKFTLSGGINAFCAQHQLEPPSVGDVLIETAVYTKATDKTSNVSRLLRKVLYYGWGGPADIGTTPDTSGGKGQDAGATNDASHFRRTALAASVANQNEDNFYKYGKKFIDYLSRFPDAPEGFEVHKLESPRRDEQDLVFYKYNPKGKAQVLKESANPDITNNNPCYSLEGAEYKIYSDKSASSSPLATLKTNKNGSSNVVELNAGTYYIKETKAPLGYALDPKIYSITVTSGKTATFKHKDLPQLDPVAILLGKIDRETNQNKPQGSASLKDAHFTVKYYSGLWDKNKDPAILGYTPIRTWVFATDEDGFSYYDERFKVSGDALYLSPTGKASLPIGTITIQETKAPNGYHLNPELFVIQITPEGNDQFVSTYNQPIIPEEILKLELIKKQAGTDVVIPNVTFTHTLPDGTKEYVTTDSSGKLTIKGLTRGRHKLQETDVMDGYLLNGNVLEFEVSEDNKITLVSNIDDSDGKVTFEVTKEGNISIVMEDKLAPFQLKLQKYNDKKMVLQGAEFTLYSEKECINELQKAVTDYQGILTMKDLEVGKKYYIQETKAPKGYRIPTDLFGNPIVYEFYTESTPAKGEFIFYVDGKAYTSASDPNGMFTVTGTPKDRVVNMKIINNIGKLLPETGSSGTTILFLLGTTCILLYFYLKKYQEMKGKNTMKNMKKLFSIVFVITLLMTSAVSSLTVNAASSTTPGGVADFGRGNASITIDGNKDQSLVGKKFNVYELFHAENSVGGESINYTFNDPFKLPLQTVVGKKLNKPASTVTEYEVIDYIQTLNTNPVEGAQAEQKLEGSYSSFRYFVEELRNEIVRQGATGDVVTVTDTTGSNSIKIGGLEYGYYIVDEVSNVSGSHSAASLCIVNTANPDADVVVKSDYPSVIKKIQEDDGRENIGNEGWNDMADFEIGQTVPYKYTSNIPNMNGYDTYYYAWHDKMDQALTFKPESVSIKINDKNKEYTLKPSEFSVIENPGDGETFKIEVRDIKAIVDREFDQMNDLKENIYNQQVTVRYDAVLNDLAAKDTGMPGFENDVKLEFSNDPDSAGVGSTGETPWDTVVCFTYKLNLLKTNDHALHLEGAKFRLYSDEDCTNEVYVKKEADGYHVINRDSVNGSDHTGGTVPNNAVEMVTDKNGDIVILGLDGGTYWLKETEAPAGYRKILDPIRVEMRPSFALDRNNYVKGDGANGKALTKLEAYAYIKQFLSGIFKEENLTLTTDLANGSANINVINTVGKKLPITGSNGMMILLGAGCVLIVLAKKFSKKEETNN